MRARKRRERSPRSQADRGRRAARVMAAGRMWALSVCAAAATAFAQPVARPTDPDATASARVVVAVQTVGRIAYDGLTLPLSSPDATYLASQTTTNGRPPAWEILLGVGRQSPPAGVRLLVKRIDMPTTAAPADRGDKPPAPATPKLVSCEPADPLATGLLLGRSADASGFLIESPRQDGSRWIGRVDWLTQRVHWLVQRPDTVCAHATLAPGQSPSTWAYVERSTNGVRFTRLVAQLSGVAGADRLAVYSAEPGESLAFPIYSADGRTLAVIAIQSSKLQLIAFDVAVAADIAPESRGERTLRPIARLDLSAAPDPTAPEMAALHIAYQCVAAQQSPVPMLEVESTGDRRGSLLYRSLSIFSPRDGAPIWWDPRGDHVIAAANGSFLAIPFRHTDWGVLTADDSSLGYQALKFGGAGDGGATLSREVQVLAGRHIPRFTTRRIADGTETKAGTVGITLLLGAPKSGDDQNLDVRMLAPAASE